MTATRVCRVRPDLPAVSRSFDYLVPRELAEIVRVGSIVRVPLHGRRVRGWVVADDVVPEAADPMPLLAAVSDGPPAEVVDLCDWVAWRFAGPATAVLRTASPPNRVEPGSEPELAVAVYPEALSPLPDIDPHAGGCIEWPPALPRDRLVGSLLASEGSTIVVVPDAREADAVAVTLRNEGREVVVLHGDQPAATRTAAWDDARRGARVVVGGRIALFAPVRDLAAVIVLDDADEALKDERIPAWNAREVGRELARRAGAPAWFVAPVPTSETVRAAGLVLRSPRRTERAGWPQVDLVDLRDEPPGTGVCGEALGAALQRVVWGGGRAACILNRRGRAVLLACRACGELVRCPDCGAAWGQPTGGELQCARCGATGEHRGCARCGDTRLRVARAGTTRVRDDVAGLVPRATVVEVDAATDPVPRADVYVGTEAVLHRVPDRTLLDLVVFLDFDAELLAPRFRAAEQALWLLARAARRLGPFEAPDAPSGPTKVARRLLVQTRVPDHEVLDAARARDVGPFLAAEMERRRALGYPPFGGLAELSGSAEAVAVACAVLEADDGADGPVRVLGPSRGRALLRTETAAALSDVLARTDFAPARAKGRLRIEVEPLRI